MAKTHCPEALDGFKRLGSRVPFDFTDFADEEAAFADAISDAINVVFAEWCCVVSLSAHSGRALQTADGDVVSLQ